MQDEPIPAASVIVARDRAGGPPELLMIERAAGMAFAGGALVFPGGRIDAADSDLATELGGPDAAARVAAIRETREEAAVPVGLNPLPPRPLCLDLQQALLAGSGLRDLALRHGFDIAISALTPFARWLPKIHVKRRFDTMFFIARAPVGEWPPATLEAESSGAFWLSAGEVLKLEAERRARLIFPTNGSRFTPMSMR